MKRLFSIILAALTLCACGTYTSSNNSDDVAYIQNKGTLIVGVTPFKPMDYEENGEWIGFDADLAKCVAEDLGVKVEFVSIDWDNKVLELENKSIDVVWNGMTLNEANAKAMECTKAYCTNAQTVIVKKGTDTSDLSKLAFSVEAGSAGEEVASEKNFQFTSLETQADTLLEVQAGTSEAAIIDLIMAGATIGEGTSYPDLVIAEELNSEEYAIGCRKGSNLASYIDEALARYKEDGRLMEIAKKYGVDKAIQ
ncbi:MAG: transporter substrate-binding domain-containing protein [Solobacterium sp.]|nr:transporter substrate-binding domain-containing protein [Solobacterium sp.]